MSGLRTIAILVGFVLVVGVGPHRIVPSHHLVQGPSAAIVVAFQSPLVPAHTLFEVLHGGIGACICIGRVPSCLEQETATEAN